VSDPDLEAFDLHLDEIDRKVQGAVKKRPADDDLNEMALSVLGLSRLLRDVFNRPPWLDLWRGLPRE
jgi:hypothetical protein